MKTLLILTAVICSFFIIGCDDWTTTETGLKYYDEKIGEGAEAVIGKNVEIHYSGYLWIDGKKGEQFDSSIPRDEPLAFKVGAPSLIAGFTEGVTSMKVGGKRVILIPPDLGYGKSGRPPVIPPNSTLLFEMELVSVK